MYSRNSFFTYSSFNKGILHRAKTLSPLWINLLCHNDL
jgi:hypothetical protein